MRKHICLKAVLFALAAILFAGCSKKSQNVLTLWTDNVEFASYVELFNASQNDVKIATVYKAELTNSLLAAKGKNAPDIIAGSYLGYGMEKHLYSSLSGLFRSNLLQEESFYEDLLNSGKIGKTQYLIPVSFNLGTLVCDENNKELIDQNTTTISFDQIKSYSKKFNQKNKENIYTKMAFAPQWNPDFLYMVLVSNDVTFELNGDSIKYNVPVIENCCNYLSEWTNSINSSFNDERDFAFKYLYTPFNKQVLQQKSLFAYTSSDKLLSLSEDQLDKIDFFWFSQNDRSPVMETMVCMGIYTKSKNKRNAQKFIIWFMNKDSQEKMINRRVSMKLDTNTFGIANGFSSLISVNEQVLPLYYKCLLAKIPSPSFPKAPEPYPANWEIIKKEIICPFIRNSIFAKQDAQIISQSYKEWINQNKEE